MLVLPIIVKRELRTWFLNAVLYSYCVLFSFFALAVMFLLSGFIEVNEASLSYAFFRWLPWIFAIVVPVIGIRSWSQEHSEGVFEVLGTQPIRMSHLVLGKALAAFTVVALSLVLTFPALLTVLWLGEPELGVLVSGYLGSFLCGCAFVAVSQTICAQMRGSIGAYVCSVALCLLLMTIGVTKVANIILGTFPSLEWMTQLLAAVSVTPKFTPFIEGRIELAGVIGFALIIITALSICYRTLMAQRGSVDAGSFGRKAFVYGAPVWFSLCAYVVSSVVVGMLPGRLDLTDGQRFGLPQAVSEELSGLDRHVTVRLFATPRHPNFGFDHAQYQRRIEEMMDQVTGASKEQVQFEVLDPNINARAARIAASDDVKSFSVGQGDPFMFGMVVESLDNKRVFDVIDPSRARYFLADLVQSIVQIGRSKRKTIGVLSPFSATRTDNLASQNWAGINSLKKTYDLKPIALDGEWGKPDIIIVLHPNQMSAKLSERLKIHVEQGGDLVVLADPYSLMSAMFAQSGSHKLQSSSLPNFVVERGIELINARQVYDFKLATANATQEGEALNPGILTLSADQFDQTHPITSGFDLVHFVNVGALKVNEVDGYNTVSLARTSNQALLLDVETVATNNASKIERALGELEPLAAGYPLIVLQQSTQNEQEGRVLVASDSDWVFGMVTGMEDQNGKRAAFNANSDLMQNMIDFLSGERSLSALRKLSLAKRPLHRWESMRQRISDPFRGPLAALSQSILTLENDLTKIENARQVSSSQLQRSSQIETQVAELNTRLRLKKAEQSKVRSQRAAKVQTRLNVIKWLNVLTVPLLLVMVGLMVTFVRAKTVRGTGA